MTEKANENKAMSQESAYRRVGHMLAKKLREWVRGTSSVVEEEYVVQGRGDPNYGWSDIMTWDKDDNDWNGYDFLQKAKEFRDSIDDPGFCWEELRIVRRTTTEVA